MRLSSVGVVVVRHRRRLQRLADALRRDPEPQTIGVVWVDADGVTVASVPPGPMGPIEYRRGLVGDATQNTIATTA